MSQQFDASHLTADELTYELRIRNAPERGTHEDHVKLLSALLEMERSGMAFPLRTDTLDPVTELEECRRKLNETAGMCAQTPFIEHHASLALLSRLLHLKGRIQNLPHDYQRDLIGRLALVMSEIKFKTRRPPPENTLTSIIDPPRYANSLPASLLTFDEYASPRNTPTSSAPPRVDNSFVNPDFLAGMNRLSFGHFSHISAESSSERGSTQKVTFANPCSTFLPPVDAAPPPVTLTSPCSNIMACNLPHTNPGLSYNPAISKWNLTFDGTSGVNQFLERVSELASARHVS